VAGVLVVLLVAGPARADFFVELKTGPTPVAGGYAYDYDLVFNTVVNNFEVRNGDFATIYDIGPADSVVDIIAPSGFSFTVQPIGLNAFGTSPPVDDPGLVNVTFTRTGGTVAADQIFAARIVSKLEGTHESFYSAQEFRKTPAIGPKGNVGTVLVPVPEPGSMALVGIGLVSALGLRWRRKLRAAC
jgi:hypothetical protein